MAFLSRAGRLSTRAPATTINSKRPAHTASIHFLGKERWDHSPSEAGPHPAAPKEQQEQFSAFLSKQTSSTRVGANKPSAAAEQVLSKSGKPPGQVALPKVDYKFWWELPSRFRRRKPIEEEEMALIESGGARCTVAGA